MSRDPESIAFETEYWQQVTTGVLTINSEVANAAGALATHSPDLALVTRSLARTQTALQAILEIVDGREKAIRRELEGDGDEA